MASKSANLLVDAERLLQAGVFGGRLNQLVFQTCEVLDDMDAILMSLHPVRNAGEFAKAAALHRRLERLQAARARAPVGAPRPASKRIYKTSA